MIVHFALPVSCPDSLHACGMPRLSGAKIAVEAGAMARTNGLPRSVMRKGLPSGSMSRSWSASTRGLDLRKEGRCGGAVAAKELGGGECKIAHQALDHETAHAVGIAQAEAAHRGKPVFGDAAVIIGHRHAVLNVALREAADGRGAEPNERVGRIGCVALKIAVDGTEGEGSVGRAK
jgi:hypothetical protein